MLREILFRGKRVDNGVFIMGHYDYDGQTDKHYIHAQHYAAPSYTDPGGECYSEYVEVIPETVGQFTGLTDKNGTKIFEGDTVHILYNGLGFINVEFNNGAFNISRYNVKSTLVTGNIHDK